MNNKTNNDFPELIPIFPLKGVVMFPDTYLPLNIFEPRYLEMINKANSVDTEHKYSHGLLPEWKPEMRFELVHSMEFLYYLQDPAEMISIIHDEWLNDGGVLIAGVDHYLEHEESLTWPEHVGVHMTTLQISQWKEAMELAGFTEIEIHQVASKEGFPGTLVMLGRANH